VIRAVVRRVLAMLLSGPVDVVDNAEGGYYEVRVAGHVAGVLAYQRAGRRRAVRSVAVDEAFRGRGLAQVLMGRALDDIRAHGETISSHCPIMDRFLVDNPRYQGLVHPDHPVRALRSAGGVRGQVADE
jgi:predicted GNAT family acetyltransferase